MTVPILLIAAVIGMAAMVAVRITSKRIVAWADAVILSFGLLDERIRPTMVCQDTEDCHDHERRTSEPMRRSRLRRARPGSQLQQKCRV